MTTGLLLANLGTPDSPSVPDVRRYLRQFLSDPRVVDLNPVGRWLLLNLIILPFRPKRSAHAYKSIWMAEGSPLLVHSQALAQQVAERLPHVPVELGMRYGSPSLPQAVQRLVAAGVDQLVLFPLYPQHASSTTGSSIEEVVGTLAGMWNVPALHVVPAFPVAPEFVDTWATNVGPALKDASPDHVLMSFHGLPVRHIEKSRAAASPCLGSPQCCNTWGAANAGCYRAQCFASARALAAALGLAADMCTVSFQSRLGKDPWVGPDTESTLVSLAGKGVKKLAVLCPSFVADCLETLEEMGLRGREAFLNAGGQTYTLLPCLNATPAWADAVVRLAQQGCTWLQPSSGGRLLQMHRVQPNPT